MNTVPAISADITNVIPWIPDQTACLMWAGPQVNFPLAPERLIKEIEFGPDNSFCIRDQDAIKAFGQLMSKQSGSLHMARIIVDPDSRRQGYGFQICIDLIQIARERNARALTLNVYRDNIEGLRLYRGLGFKDVQKKSTAEHLHMIKEIV